MPALTTDQTTLALAVVAGIALLSLLAALAASLRLRKVRKEYMVLRGDRGDRDILAAVGSALRRVDVMEKRVDSVAQAQDAQTTLGRFALQKFYMVRYDAFDDMGGRLSFSAALLDDHGDGIVFTSINGRSETRSYAKEIFNLSSEHNLSHEEREAIAGAVAARARGNVRASASR